MISFTCPNCEKGFRVRDGYAGKRAKCFGCGRLLEIPAKAGPAPSSDSGATTKSEPKTQFPANTDDSSRVPDDDRGRTFLRRADRNVKAGSIAAFILAVGIALSIGVFFSANRSRLDQDERQVNWESSRLAQVTAEAALAQAEADLVQLQVELARSEAELARSREELGQTENELPLDRTTSGTNEGTNEEQILDMPNEVAEDDVVPDAQGPKARSKPDLQAKAEAEAKADEEGRIAEMLHPVAIAFDSIYREGGNFVVLRSVCTERFWKHKTEAFATGYSKFPTNVSSYEIRSYQIRDAQSVHVNVFVSHELRGNQRQRLYKFGVVRSGDKWLINFSDYFEKHF